ncbi:hypothetical protein AWV79_26745 [Cupriavidus sp. UYMMa02A]|nr:hypothetical protein AWV79_26745 [Cupriavidus sp. UYMMa02A]
MGAENSVELKPVDRGLRSVSHPELSAEEYYDEGLPARRRRVAVGGVWLALIVCILDTSIASVALPTIALDLGAKPADAIGIVSAFQLGVVISLLPLAALGDIITYRRIFLIGLTLFTIASIGCVVSHTLGALVLSRALQGIGAAGVMSVNGALARYIYPRHQLGAALGANALIIAAFGALGPTIATAILAGGPWQYLFAINLPIGATALALAFRALPESPKAHHKLDATSAMLNVIAFAALLMGADLLGQEPAVNRGYVLLTIGLMAGFALIRRCTGQAQPLVPIDLLRSKVTRLSALTSMLTFVAQTLTQIALPFYAQSVLHLSLVQTGLLMTAWPVGVAVAAPIAGRLADRVPDEVLVCAGLTVMTLGLASFLWVTPGHDSLWIALRMAICGVGFGCFQSPNNRTLLSSAPMHRSGAAAGLVAIARTTGQIIGAVLVAVSFRIYGEVGTAAISISATLTAIAAASSFIRHRHRHR